ncbi:hypothetical protein [Haloactinospora alba]|uniref:hypothetical protein n=1 Tax=Haloactinospora alba TaxID=405555 RepID=UPI001153E6D5|nr:hypothetical protein [Haloactinospora alba]
MFAIATLIAAVLGGLLVTGVLTLRLLVQTRRLHGQLRRTRHELEWRYPSARELAARSGVGDRGGDRRTGAQR